MADGSVKIDIVADDSDIKRKLDEVGDEAEQAADKLDDLGDSSKNSGKGFDIASVALGGFVANGLTALVSKAGEALSSLVALADETREYREDIAKLEASFTSNNKSVDAAHKAYDRMYAIIGETDQTVEATQQISLLAKSEENVVKWSELAAGVVGKFGDALQPETFYESANETLKLGEATGAYTQMLEGTGYSVDKFNAGLAALSTEAEKEAYMLEVTQGILGATATEYNTLTASTQAAREATNRMEQSQAALGATLEPLTTWWTNAKASMLSWAVDGVANVVNGITTLATNTDVLSEKQRTLVNEVNSSAKAYKDAKIAASELAAAQMADVDYATNYLLPQLQELIDSNGRVKQGYEERAAFILGQLNEAYGTEYTRISEIIGKNGELTQSITNAINAKKAQILLEEHSTAYETAIKNIDAEMLKRDEALAEMSTHAIKLEEIEKRKRDIYKETEDAFYSGVESQIRQATIKRSKIDAEYNAEKKALDELGTAYNTSNELIEGYNKDINVYTEATTLMMQGKTEEAIGYLQNLNKGYEETESQAKKTADEQTAAVEGRLKAAAVALGLLKEEYKTNEAKMTEAQKQEMQKRLEAAQKEVESYGKEAEKMGSNLVEGIGIGADGKKDWLSGKLGGIVTAAIDAAKKAGIIKSPSRKMRDEVGKMLAAGIAVGVDDWADKPAEAVKGVFASMEKVLDNEQKDIVDNVKDYNAEITDLEKEKNKKLAEIEEKFIADKKKKGADKKALEKQYAKDIESINEQHAEKVANIQENIKKTITGKMQEIVSLEEKYKEDTKKVFDDLAKSLEDVQANYDNQLKSRTESIANSLNLWGEVVRERVSDKELKTNLISQINALEDFNNAIATLEERNVGASFINSLKEMGVGSVDEIRAISKMTEEELTKYVELWEKKNELAKTAAVEELEPLKAETEAKIEELTNAALDKYAELRAEYQNQGSVLMAELKQAMLEAGQGGYEEIIGQIDEYTSAGEDLMGGIIAGIVDKSPFVVDAVKSAVNRAIQAAKDAAGIASPSKVMKKEVGANLAEGMSVGWTDKIDAVKKKIALDTQGIIARIQTAVSLEQARMTQGVGVRDTGFTEVAQAVGMQTAGINSLASEYRRGSSAQVTVPLVLDGRELGRAIVDLGNAETVRTGTALSFA